MNTDGHGFNRDVGPKVGSSLASAVEERPRADCLQDDPRKSFEEEVGHGIHGAHGRRSEFRVVRVFRGRPDWDS